MFKQLAKTPLREGEIIWVSPSRILPCPYQPRKLMNRQALDELTESVKENGILQPLTATLTEDGRYQLIAGHRRLLAATKAGLSRVPVILMDKSREEVAVLAVIENLQREDLNCFEQAAAIQSLMSGLNLTQSQVGQKLSLSQPAVANKLKLLQFDARLQKKMLAYGLTERHARAIARLPVEKQEKAIDHVAKNNLNVSATDRYITGLLSPAIKQNKGKKAKIAVRDIRLFTNTITKAVKVMQSAGIQADWRQEEDENYIKYQITVPKTCARAG